MNERLARVGLIGILATFVLLASTYAYVTPTLEAPDEIYHYDYIRSLVNTGSPPGTKENEKSFSNHAPLYYAIGALGSAWVGENDLDAWHTRYNPHFGYRFGDGVTGSRWVLTFGAGINFPWKAPDTSPIPPRP